MSLVRFRPSVTILVGLTSALIGSLLAASAASAAVTAAGTTQDELQAGDRVLGQYVVVLKDSVEHPGEVAHAQAEARDGDLGFVYRHALDGYSVADLSRADVEALRRNPQVKYVTPDYVMTTESEEEEPEIETQAESNEGAEAGPQVIPTGIERIFAPENEALRIDGKDDLRVDADVAVIDTGIDAQNPDLNVVARANCVISENGGIKGCVDNSGNDGSGHATHVAGTIGGLDNGFGVVGVAPGVRLWSVKVLNVKGSGFSSQTINGVDWVTAHAGKIEAANMSLGCTCSNPALKEAIEHSAEAGVVYAIAAGNDAHDVQANDPAGNPDAITVSALSDYDGKPGGEGSPTCVNHGPDDTLATFSNYGKEVNVAAPGVCIYSTQPGGGYSFKSGTSMATPHVTGAAALLASADNPEDLNDVKGIRQTIEEEGSQAWKDTSGDGIQEPLLDVGDEAVFAPTDAVVSTGRASVLSPTEVTLHGAVNPSGRATEYRFEYGPTAEYGASAPAGGASAGSGSKYTEVEETLKGLEVGTPYHYRLVATNSNGTFYGADRVVLVPSGPMAYSGGATKVEGSKATFNGTVNPEGLETTYYFEYGLYNFLGSGSIVPRQTIPASPTSVGSGYSNVAVSQTVTELDPEKAYYYRLVAENKAGTSYGLLKVIAKPPLVTTTAATTVGSGAATLNAVVNPNGIEAKYHFEYDTAEYKEGEEAHGTSTVPAATGTPLAGNFKFKKTINGLEAGTTYHYRVVASNELGTTYGMDETFTTDAPLSGSQLNALAITDPFDGSASSLADFKSNFSALGWASGSTPKGSDGSSGWRSTASYPTLNGIYYTPSFTDVGRGLAGAVKMALPLIGAGHYFSLWIDMPTPASTKAGYQLLVEYVSAGHFKLTLSKWVGGTRTELASEASYALGYGSSVALVDQGQTVSAWVDTGSGFTQLLSASDSAFAEGRIGIDANEPLVRLTNFRAAALEGPPDTTITGGSSGKVTPDVSFAFKSSKEGSTFECALDAGSYSACSSPKSYEGLSEGSHAFKVRAVGAGGADPTPAERTVTIVETTKAVSGVSVLDDFGREEIPLANGKWTKASWAQEIGSSWASPWHGYGADSIHFASAYWNSTTFNDASAGLLASATLGTGPVNSGEYLSLWLDMPNPGSARSGYEARFTCATTICGSAYKVELAKWVSGTRTVLGTKEGVSLPKGMTFALTETGGSLTIWTGTSSLSRVLSAYDATYSSGYAGIEANKGAGTAYDFRAGNVTTPPDTTITGGSSGKVTPDVSFAFKSDEGGSTFECALDAGSYSACSSPKSYQGLSEGSHTFKVRAVGVGGTDPTPAERTVTVVETAKAVSGVSVLDDFEREEIPLANGKWTKASWAQEIGSSWASPWHGYGADGSYFASAYWNAKTFSDASAGLLASATLGTGPINPGEYLSLWLDMPNPSSARSGYEARFICATTTICSSAYKVELAKWVSGTRTVLSTKEGVSLSVDTTFALTETGGSLTIWTGTASLSRVLSAYDATYSSGYAGIEANEGASTAYDFRAGNVQ